MPEIRFHLQVDTSQAILDLKLAEMRVEAAAQSVIATYAFRIASRAKELAPVDTGRLRASIQTVVKRLAAEVGTDVEYAPYQEFGTRYQEAQPFLEPAFEDLKPDFLRAYREAVMQALQ